MSEVFFLNCQKMTMMKWFGFFLQYKDEDPQYVNFDMELNVSIFSAKKKYEVNIKEIEQLKKDLALMNDSKINYVLFCPLGEFTSIEFIRDNRGALFVRGEIDDFNIPQSELKFSYQFDQILLPELIRNIDNALRSVLN